MFALMMVPAQVLLIPNYLILQNMGLWILCIPDSSGSRKYRKYLLMRQFFMNFRRKWKKRRIDGLGRYARFFRICMPLARPTIKRAIFVFMILNEFTKVMLYIKSAPKYTLTLGLQFQSRDAELCGIRLWRQHVFECSHYHYLLDLTNIS